MIGESFYAATDTPQATKAVESAFGKSVENWAPHTPLYSVENEALASLVRASLSVPAWEEKQNIYLTEIRCQNFVTNECAEHTYANQELKRQTSRRIDMIFLRWKIN